MVLLFEISTTAARNCAPISSANAMVDSIESIVHPLANRNDREKSEALVSRVALIRQVFGLSGEAENVDDGACGGSALSAVRYLRRGEKDAGTRY